ncbi:hypothetical protein NP493_19g11001 [Ridgeia piscesae]|uniref:Glutamate receptor n=1 Tax=Ridgeia piscesae TaxID=27915 RepID=A0AAD9PDV0_RIDPI|nr:hypothetical protein NP493_19g11001 [Ridgeia piscesae]
MFDHTSVETSTALGYKLMVFNRDQSRLKLTGDVVHIAMNDSYSVTTNICSFMSRGIIALFGTHRASSINAIKSYTSTFRMPFITPSMAINKTGQQHDYELYMSPLYAGALVSIIRKYEWRKIYYLYGDDEGLLRMQQLFDALAEAGYIVEVDMKLVTDADDALDTLDMFDRLLPGNKRVVLDLPTAVCDALLKRLNGDMRRVQYHFLLGGLGINELQLEGYRHGGINMTGFRLIDFLNQTVKAFMDEWSSLDPKSWHGAGTAKISYEAALAVDAVTLIGRTLSKFMRNDPNDFTNAMRGERMFSNGSYGVDCDSDPPIPWKHGRDVANIMKDEDFYGITGKVAFDQFGLRRDYKLDLLEVNLDRGLAKIGTWNPGEGLQTLRSPALVRNKGNNTIANRTRIVTSILTAPYLMLRSTPKGGAALTGNDRYEGYCADLARKIADRIGIDYLIQPVADSKYGSRDDNGTWNGMVGELVRNEADLAIAPLTITSVRERVIDFSKPFMSLGISIMISKPTKETPGVFSFLFPLSYEIWMCVIFAYIGVSVVLFLVSRFSPFEWHIEDNTDGPTVTNNFTIFNSLWFSLGAFMQQGCDIEPRSMSGRIVGSVWWFFTLIIMSSYTANLAAFLTVERMNSPIESAEDLAKQTEIKYGTIDSGSTKEFFRSSTIAVFERMWAFMDTAEPSVFVGSNEAGVSRVRSERGRYAFLTESTNNDYINQRKPCDTMKVGNNLDSKGYGIGTPLGSDLRDRVTLAVLMLREKGVLHKLEKKWWFDLGECGKDTTGKKGDTTSSLKLQNVAGIFYILVGGLLLALIMAVLEFLFKAKMEAERRKTSFVNAVRSKARLSIKGKPEKQTPAVGVNDLPLNVSITPFQDSPPGGGHAGRQHYWEGLNDRRDGWVDGRADAWLDGGTGRRTDGRTDDDRWVKVKGRG